MLALTLREPWCTAVLEGKPIENRGWLPSRGGPLPLRFLLHAGKAMSAPDYDEACATMRALGFAPPRRESIRLGGLVGVTTVVDVIRAGTIPALARAQAKQHGADMRWWVPDFNGHPNHGWILKDTERRPFLPCRGNRLFFHVPDDVAARFLGEAGQTDQAQAGTPEQVRRGAGKSREACVAFDSCDACDRSDPHIHCPECGDTRHSAADCDMEG